MIAARGVGVELDAQAAGDEDAALSRAESPSNLLSGDRRRDELGGRPGSDCGAVGREPAQASDARGMEKAESRSIRAGTEMRVL